MDANMIEATPGMASVGSARSSFEALTPRSPTLSCPSSCCETPKTMGWEAWDAQQNSPTSDIYLYDAYYSMPAATRAASQQQQMGQQGGSFAPGVGSFQLLAGIVEGSLRIQGQLSISACGPRRLTFWNGACGSGAGAAAGLYATTLPRPLGFINSRS